MIIIEKPRDWVGGGPLKFLHWVVSDTLRTIQKWLTDYPTNCDCRNTEHLIELLHYTIFRKFRIKFLLFTDTLPALKIFAFGKIMH